MASGRFDDGILVGASLDAHAGDILPRKRSGLCGMRALAFRDTLRRERDWVAMTSDGISSEDWEEVHELALAVANASDDEDGPHRERLFACLYKLISKYGELPSILATEADYVDDPAESERLFLRAFDLALARGDRSDVREISLSLANHYARDLLRLGDASHWLEIANAYIRPDSEMDRSEYQDIEEAIARLKKLIKLLLTS